MFLAGAAYGSAGTGFLLSRVRLSASQGEPVRVHQLTRVDLLVIGQDLWKKEKIKIIGLLLKNQSMTYLID